MAGGSGGKALTSLVAVLYFNNAPKEVVIAPEGELEGEPTQFEGAGKIVVAFEDEERAEELRSGRV